MTWFLRNTNPNLFCRFYSKEHTVYDRWSLLQRCDEIKDRFSQVCQALETAVMQFIASFRWPNNVRIGFWVDLVLCVPQHVKIGLIILVSRDEAGSFYLLKKVLAPNHIRWYDTHTSWIISYFSFFIIIDFSKSGQFNIVTSTILNKYTIKMHFIVNLMKLIWCTYVFSSFM